MDVLSTVFSFQDYGELLVLVQNSIWAGAVLGIVGGLIGPFVVARNMPSRCTASRSCRSPGPVPPCCSV